MNDNVFRLAPKKQPPAVLLTCVLYRVDHHFALTVTLADDAESTVSAAMMDDHQNANFNRASAPISSTTSSPRHLRPPLSSFDGPVPFAHVSLLQYLTSCADATCAVRGAVPTLYSSIRRRLRILRTLFSLKNPQGYAALGVPRPPTTSER